MKELKEFKPKRYILTDRELGVQLQFDTLEQLWKYIQMFQDVVKK